MTLELISSPSRTPLPVEKHDRPPGLAARVVTALIVGIPFLTLVFGVIRFWGRGIHVRDVLLAVVLYVLIGHGMTIGFHRLLAHKSFTARRSIKRILVVFGSMAYEEEPIGRVANHRRHHVFADTASDPHSPQRHGGGVQGQLKGPGTPTSAGCSPPAAHRRRHAVDLLADRDIVVMDELFPVWCVVSLALPFGLGWLLGGTLGAAFSALIWAGLVRVCVLHHATWSVNSLGHMFGRRPFATKDRSSNVAALAIISMGESWHNGHHAFHAPPARPAARTMGLLGGAHPLP